MPHQKLPIFQSIQEYDAMRPNLDVEAFKSAAVEIAQQHNLPKDSLKLFPDGSNVIFSHGLKRGIKIFPALLKGQFESEALVLKHLQNKLSVPTPSLEHAGEYQGWLYLIMSRVEGESLGL